MSPTPPTGEAPQPRSGRRGTGGRWRVYAGRTALWTVIVIVGANGTVRLAEPWLPSPEPAQAQPQDAQEEGSNFPEDAAGSFAASFAEVYLQPTAEDEGEEVGATLADFVPEDSVRQYLLPEAVTGSGVRIVQVQANDDQNALVTVSALVNGEPMHLEVPVHANTSGTALVVSGPPALLPAPAQATLPEPTNQDTDGQARDAMEPVVSGFLAAYAETPEHLSRYVEPGARVAALPTGTFAFISLDDLDVPPGSADEPRSARATVTWQVAEGADTDTLVQRYDLTMVESSGAWYVRDIQGAVPTRS
ncbi:conjugal transfer protein (plasmid) [Nocardiopsis exhalans]|uniref:Conjugal transfer protein n=1 Tax=Nocardiopsis exhalans TaxID=163604 RepID=A0ABY5DI79_9ACTN|nr:conjugal transfer protein [Nocardiopsis exhalans]USY23541.1 conjugal transfer protein [Nocardiopsis exhalans]